MIGPVAPGESFMTQASFSAAPTLPGVLLEAEDGSVAIAHSTSGIITGQGNTRKKKLVAPNVSVPTWFTPYWDDNGGAPKPDDVVLVRPVAVSVIAAAGGGTVSPLSHLMKRGDTDPAIKVQALVPDLDADPSGKTLIPWPIPAGATVKFTMRDVADFASRTRTAFSSPTPKIHANATIDDADLGWLSYGWGGAGDTDTDGQFRGEFEVTTLAGETRTFPTGPNDATNYIAITITDDLDPGITP